MVTIKNKIINRRLIYGFLLLSIFVLYAFSKLQFATFKLGLVGLVFYSFFIILIGHKILVLNLEMIKIKYWFFERKYSFRSVEKINIQKIAINSTFNFIKIKFKYFSYTFVLDDNDNITEICEIFLNKELRVDFCYTGSIYNFIAEEKLNNFMNDKKQLFSATKYQK
jgi:hypothetical protein